MISQENCIQESGIDRVMSFVKRREWIQRTHFQLCPKCESEQQELTDWIFSKKAKWKCRDCKFCYEYEKNS